MVIFGRLSLGVGGVGGGVFWGKGGLLGGVFIGSGGTNIWLLIDGEGDFKIKSLKNIILVYINIE